MSFQTIPASAPAIDAPKPVITEELKVDGKETSPSQGAKVNPLQQEEKTDPSKEDKDLYSERMSSFIKKEKRLFKEKEEAKALRAAVEKREQELAQKEAKINQFDELKKTNPLKILDM